MAQRRNTNRIAGPRSALTDFLASNNISAAQIRETYERRTQQAQAQAHAQAQQSDIRVTRGSNTADAPAQAAVVTPADESDADASNTWPASAGSSTKKRKKPVDKKSKPAKKKKRSKDDDDDDDDDDDEYNDLFHRDMYKKAPPNPGQLENCEICEKRFTVTAYSKTGPDGGLVCGPCGRDLVKEANGDKDKVEKLAIVKGKGRRKLESKRLDGIVTLGAKTLRQICVEKVADYHVDVEDLGDLPEAPLVRLGEIFAKRRTIDPRTLKLFIKPGLETIAIHECAKLEEDDYRQIFAIAPDVRSLVLRNACQFKDDVMVYMLEKATQLEHLKLYAANLITDDMWIRFFNGQGRKLRTLQLEWLDASFTDETVRRILANCRQLSRLKLKYCRQITSASLSYLAQINSLRHLSLRLSHPAVVDELEGLVESLGPNLQTLSLENCPELDDTVIAAIRRKCGALSKLRLSPLEIVTDAALAALFGADPASPTVLRPLHFVDFTSARDVDNNNPNGPAEAPVGVADQSFKALMQHSGSRLKQLLIPSCRHISHDALWHVFVGPKEEADAARPMAYYPHLEEIDCSFVHNVDSSIVSGMFRSCPKLKKLAAFGCFHIGEVSVPRDVALVGVPHAQDDIVQFGDGLVPLGGAARDGFGVQAATYVPGVGA